MADEIDLLDQLTRDLKIKLFECIFHADEQNATSQMKILASLNKYWHELVLEWHNPVMNKKINFYKQAVNYDVIKSLKEYKLVNSNKIFQLGLQEAMAAKWILIQSDLNEALSADQIKKLAIKYKDCPAIVALILNTDELRLKLLETNQQLTDFQVQQLIAVIFEKYSKFNREESVYKQITSDELAASFLGYYYHLQPAALFYLLEQQIAAKQNHILQLVFFDKNIFQKFTYEQKVKLLNANAILASEYGHSYESIKLDVPDEIIDEYVIKESHKMQEYYKQELIKQQNPSLIEINVDNWLDELPGHPHSDTKDEVEAQESNEGVVETAIHRPEKKLKM